MYIILMNNFLKSAFTFAFCLFAVFSAYAQNSRIPLEEMVTAIKENNAQNMEKYMESFVTVSINNVQSIYSHNQAQVVLHDFFEKNDAKSMLLMDSGEPSSSSSFVIGTYNTPEGSKYTVYVLMKLKGSKYMLQEIRVNKE